VGDETLVVTALYALIEPGMTFTKAGTMLRLRLQTAVGAIWVLIEDDGTVVPLAFIERFFQPFSMTERSIAGVDLGLRPAVANRILTFFGVSAKISNQGSCGIRLTASLRTADLARP
jgi:C4-dicarboxylate-specific signal transduction histidine kinase